MSYYLLLDDIPEISDVRKYCTLPNIPDNEWILVRSYNEFVTTINKLGLSKFVSFDHNLPFMDKIVMDIYDLLKKYALTDEKGFGLDTSNVTLEKVPIAVGPEIVYNLKRVDK